ncbi:MAG: hypothetical protein NZ777_12650 [Pseudomonadales bacterium]|nr:hypothetical protein [Pseudomonadales bacterium]
MNLERFTLIVESYGADSQQWPGDERAEALEFSRTSTDAMSLLDQAAELDQHLALFELPNSELSVQRIEMGILSALKQGTLERLLNWVLPDFDDLAHTLWRPTLVACMPLLLGVAIGLTLTNNTYELSSDEELSLLAFTDTVSEEWSNE